MRTALALIDGRLCTSPRYALRPGWRPRRPAAAPSSGFPVQARAGTCASGLDATFLFGSSSSSVDQCAQGSMARPITNKALSRSPSRSLSLSLSLTLSLTLSPTLTRHLLLFLVARTSRLGRRGGGAAGLALAP